jgi:hypothetical protein
MAEGGWVVLGTAIGTTGSILTTWLSAYLHRPKPDPADETAKQLLREMLQALQWQWRKIRRLSNVVGLSDSVTRELLLEIGARGSENNPELWGLISRNPLPTHDRKVLDPTLESN